MKKIKRMMAIAIAICLSLTVLGATFVFSDPSTPSTPSITIVSQAPSDTTQTDTTTYTYWKILDASIDTDPQVAQNTGATSSDGVVAYSVDTQAKVDALTATNLFNITRVGTTDKWFVELKDSATTAQEIITALEALDASVFTTAFGNGTTFSKTANETSATSGTVPAGYYYITSTLGTKAAVQTLTAVTINEKNGYPSTNKEIATEDLSAQIGDTINYTLDVVIPESANDVIVLTDTMSTGLTFAAVGDIVPYTGDTAGTKLDNTTTGQLYTVGAVDAGTNSFTITFPVETVKAYAGKTLKVAYTATLNKDAQISTDIPNTVKLDYGNNYESKPVTVNTKTYPFSFDKVDGTNTLTKLTGAEYKLTKDSAATKDTTTGWIDLVEVEAGKTYRVKMSEDTATPVTTISTNGNTITINGLDIDETYYLVEIKAPTGYNVLNSHIEVKADSTTHLFEHKDVQNNKGTQLPSTGGIGTTIFYIIGAILVAGAAIILVTRRRMNAE